MNQTNAILVVSFGTSVNETRRLTIDVIEQDIRDAYPKSRIYRAWTSKIICEKLWNRDRTKIDSVREAFLRMKRDGITDVIVQPTHVINGIENDRMKEDALIYSKDFSSIRFGNPLLTSDSDSDALISAIVSEFPDLTKKEMLVLMGHGTTHYANSIYAALDYRMKDHGFSNIFLGTVEAYPAIESLLRAAAERRPERILLAPFMIVAGDHAVHDMSGDDRQSWRSRFEAEGYRVECFLKGLGEYPAVRDLLVKHVREAV